MRVRTSLAILILVPLVLAQEARESAVVSPSTPSSVATKGTIRKTLDREGTFVPADAAEMRLDLDSWRGELTVVEVVPHGSFVNEGDILVRLDMVAIDQKIEEDGMAVARAEMGLKHAEEAARLRAEAEAEALARSETASQRAAKKLRGYRELEKRFDEENERLGIQQRAFGLENQKDELDQLEKMYAEDELVDATEEIVLKRSRRGFAQSQAWNSLSEQRRVYDKDWYYAWREEDLVVDADNKAHDLERVKKNQAMAREKSDTELEKTRYDLAQQKKKFDELKRDRERFAVRSPRRGIFLHGAPDDAPWGRLEKGSQLRNKSVFACVGDPKKVKVTTTIAEADILKIKTGTAVEVAPVAAEDAKMIGRLEVEYLPQKGNIYKGTVQLGQADLRVRPGFACKAVVILEEERDAVLVPKAAVIERDGGQVVRCAKAEGGPFEERQVVVGISDGKNVVIREGIEVGEYVAVEPGKGK
jgi:multidrug efflux pump subunit AcrA (membrane-fusion protein)